MYVKDHQFYDSCNGIFPRILEMKFKIMAYLTLGG